MSNLFSGLKYLIIALLLCSSVSDTVAQAPQSQQTLELEKQWHAMLRKQQKGMLVLGSWALANIGSGLILQGRYEDERRYFHTMNVTWNSVNLGLAGLGYLRTAKLKKSKVTEEQFTAHYINTRQTLLFNAGLDLAYMASGWALIERSGHSANRASQMRGFGQSLILQGGCLFVFDLLFYRAIGRSKVRFSPIFTTGQGHGVSMVLQL